MHYASTYINTHELRITYICCHFRPIKSAIGVGSGRNFLNSPQIHPFDDPESFSLIEPASWAVHFQSGNKNTKSKNGHKLVKKNV